MTLKIGITGGIGTGKTAASNFFKELGIPIFNADNEAKWLMSNQEELKEDLIKLLGSESYVDGKLNRPYIASQIFNNQDLKIKMEQIVHPAVGKHFISWLNNYNTPYILKEAALIFEINDNKNLDYTIVVDAPLETRIQRVLNRDESTREQIESRINNQMDQTEKVKQADFIINNISDLEHLKKEVQRVDKLIKALI
jgi:dephospho-CoA kinase